MEDSVVQMLKVEQEVNQQVREAQAKKTHMLKNIKENSEGDLQQYKAMQKNKFDADLK